MTAQEIQDMVDTLDGLRRKFHQSLGTELAFSSRARIGGEVVKHLDLAWGLALALSRLDPQGRTARR